MALTIKNSFIKEDIVDEDGNKLGELKFNPNDSRIMNKLIKIINELGEDLEKIKSIGEIPKIPDNDITSVEDFEKVADTIKKIGSGFEIEEKASDMVIENLSEVFGKEIVDLFTGGTKDIMSIMPLIEFVLPYVKKEREKKVSKYVNKKSNDVME